ncbi:MutL C terminal dimerization domain-containing protein [Mycena rebaudengoi]|nr:MutL C terminal dimerization domain-containing protein [Mycena rebaudengoi]
MFDSSDVGLTLISTTISVAPSTDEVVSRPEVIRQLDNGSGDASLRFDLSKISASWHRLRESLATACAHAQSGQSPIKVPLDAGIANMTDDDTATEALARTIDKTDFNSMEVVGQFNLGFIVARRQKAASGGASDLEVMDDLFIIDQHAADEKYNFETLQQTTHIKSQKLFRAQPLELTAGDELLALENIDVLRQNGFEILLQAENNVDDGVSGHSRQLLLTAQPVSKGTVFDMKDLEELIHLMHDQPSGQVVRCSKARAMFAMRACRKSVMVGMPLTKGQMTSVIRHMGTMDQPWNCPHGRPTMRHLTDIRGGERRETIDWSAY